MNMRKITILLLTALLTGIMSGCNSDSDATATFRNKAWTLQSWGASGAETATIAGTTVTIAFWNDGGCGGSGGCNSYGGLYTTREDGGISITEIYSTEMYCESAGVSDQEALFFARLAQATRWEMVNNTLYLHYGNSERMVFTTQP